MMPSDSHDRDVLAGEYVLGQLDGDLLAEFERHLADDPDLARRVAAWEQRLLPALASLRPERPDAGLWTRIERDLAPAAAVLAIAQASRPARERAGPGRLWHNTALWRAATGLATAAAIVLAVLPRLTSPVEPSTRFFVILQSRDASGAESGPGWILRVGDDHAVRSLPLGRVDPGSGRALQLWTLWDQARGPVSLGVLPPDGSVSIPPDRLPQIGGGQLFEITLEPASGSPTGRPTGRILFIGRASPSVSQSL